jgi:N6-adenosine-specific RNA methylase IME4
MKAGCLLVDCPWSYEYRNGKNGVPGREGQARDRYPTLTTAELCALPVAEVAARDSVLLMWSTWPKLEESLQVMKAWSFSYRTGFPWLKMTRAACPRVGLGYHAQSCSEPLLIGLRGQPTCPKPGFRPVGVLFNPIAEHSAKPESIYTIAEGYPGPYVELFARNYWPGWVSVGNELDNLDIRESLRRLAADEPIPRVDRVQPNLFDKADR